MNLKLINLSFAYNDNFILKKVNQEFNSDKINILKGKNGSGKTTLLKIMATFLNPTFGDILYDNQDFKKFKKHNRNLILYITHNPMLYPELTLKENINFFKSIYGGKTPENLINSFNLNNYLDIPIKDFSRGMKQKASLIISFIKDARIYLLDEPFSGLDKESQNILKDYIFDLSKKDVLIFLVSHHDINIKNSKVYLMENANIENIS